MSFENWNRYLQETISALSNEQTTRSLQNEPRVNRENPAAKTEKVLKKVEEIEPRVNPEKR